MIRSEKFFALLIVAVAAVTLCLSRYYEAPEPQFQALSAGDFITVDGETYVVTGGQEYPSRIKVEGPGPQSSERYGGKKEIVVTNPNTKKGVHRKEDPGWQAMATWFFTQ